MKQALSLARRGAGRTSPNPAVGALLVKNNRLIGQGWHRRAGLAHAEIEALRHAQKLGHNPAASTLYVTLEPCSTFGRTPPCTTAIIDAGIRTVIAAAADPNPAHRGAGFQQLEAHGVHVRSGLLAEESLALNKAFNHWIVHRTPWVTVKSAMSIDGKIATASGQSKWITSPQARARAMLLRYQADAILAGVRTIIADDPQLTFRHPRRQKDLRRIVLDPSARTPLHSHVVSDKFARFTTIVVSNCAPAKQVAALEKKVTVWTAPAKSGWINLQWLLRRLGSENITHLLVEGGGETNAAFLFQGYAHEVTFFYAPKIIGGARAIKAVGGSGATGAAQVLRLRNLHWSRCGPDLILTALLPDPAHHPAECSIPR